MAHLQYTSNLMGLIANSIKVYEFTEKQIIRLYDIFARCRRAEESLGPLTSRLDIEQSVLDDVSDRLGKDLFTFSQQNVKNSLSEYASLISDIKGRIAKIFSADKKLTMIGKAKYLWSENDIQAMVEELDRHKNDIDSLIKEMPPSVELEAAKLNLMYE